MNILLFLGVLVVLILVHEFGHFAAAKLSRMRVDEFGIGFPPRLWGIRRGETLYSVNALPLGGFVKIFGEDGEAAEESSDRERSFARKPRALQAVVLVSGVLGNLILAWVLLSAGFMAGMPTAADDSLGRELQNVRLVATSVLPDSPAQEGGLKRGDTLRTLSAGGEFLAPEEPGDVSAFVAAHASEEITVTVARGGGEAVARLSPRAGVIAAEPDTPAIGIAMGRVGDLRLSPPAALIEGARATYEMFGATASGLYRFAAQTLTGAGDFSQIAGPVGIVSLVGDAGALGFIYLLSFTALISVNLALINILPFPALDGGRLLFVAIEALKGSAIRPAVSRALNTAGFVLLILLTLAITYHDIARIVAS